MKIICVGRNYKEHARELNNPIPSRPLLFMKPSTALLIRNRPFYIPEFTNNLHYEAELVIKISKSGKHIKPEFASGYYQEIGLGIDFTARDLQDELKKKGHPWEIAKAFDHSAAISAMLPIHSFKKDDIHFELQKNGNTVQKGHSADMIFSFDKLVSYISRFFKLLEGDLIFTGTPEGVGPVKSGDHLTGYLQEKEILSCKIK